MLVRQHSYELRSYLCPLSCNKKLHMLKRSEGVNGSIISKVWDWFQFLPHRDFTDDCPKEIHVLKLSLGQTVVVSFTNSFMPMSPSAYDFIWETLMLGPTTPTPYFPLKKWSIAFLHWRKSLFLKVYWIKKNTCGELPSSEREH